MRLFIFFISLLIIAPSACSADGAFKGVSKGQYANLLIHRYTTYDGVKLKNVRDFNIVCHWGIDGHQYVSYLIPNQITKMLYYDNRKYKYLNVSWRCQKDYKNTHKKGTFLKYANKYY